MKKKKAMKKLIKWLANQIQEQLLTMIPQPILDAIVMETEEGKQLQEKIALLEAQLSGKNKLIADLEAMIASGAATQAEMAAKIAELQANAVDVDAVVAQIKGINPTPVSDAVVTEVIANPEIPTPALVDAAPPVAPEVVQEAPVVQAAVDALEEFTEEVAAEPEVE